MEGGSNVPLHEETMINYAFTLFDFGKQLKIENFSVFRIGVGYGEEAVALKMIFDRLCQPINLIGIDLNQGSNIVLYCIVLIHINKKCISFLSSIVCINVAKEINDLSFKFYARDFLLDAYLEEAASCTILDTTACVNAVR